MREVKFRAWLKDAKTMARVSDISLINEELDIYDEELDLPSGDWYSFDDVILMQSTGLCDKNGKEIWEGDVVREHANDYTPIYQNGIYMAYNVDKINDPYVSTQFNVIWRNGCEVVGNIHDNPELGR